MRLRIWASTRSAYRSLNSNRVKLIAMRALSFTTTSPVSVVSRLPFQVDANSKIPNDVPSRSATSINSIGQFQHTSDTDRNMQEYSRCLGPDVQPPPMERKSFVWSVSDALSDARASVSQRQNVSDQPQMSNSLTNQIFFHALPGNIHSFPVSC